MRNSNSKLITAQMYFVATFLLLIFFLIKGCHKDTSKDVKPQTFKSEVVVSPELFPSEQHDYYIDLYPSQLYNALDSISINNPKAVIYSLKPPNGQAVYNFAGCEFYKEGKVFIGQFCYKRETFHFTLAENEKIFKNRNYVLDETRSSLLAEKMLEAIYSKDE